VTADEKTEGSEPNDSKHYQRKCSCTVTKIAVLHTIAGFHAIIFEYFGKTEFSAVGNVRLPSTETGVSENSCLTVSLDTTRTRHNK
jgi:hypothetical protein